MKKLTMQIYLKSGACIEVEVTDDWEVASYNNDLTKISHPHPENWESKISYVRLDDVSAIVIKRR